MNIVLYIILSLIAISYIYVRIAQHRNQIESDKAFNEQMRLLNEHYNK